MDDRNITTTVGTELHAAIEREAHMVGMTLSAFVREMLMQHSEGELQTKQPLKVRTMDHRRRIMLPAELVAALDIQPTTPLAIFPFHRGALIRPVR